jgi:hypothetical protein
VLLGDRLIDEDNDEASCSSHSQLPLHLSISRKVKSGSERIETKNIVIISLRSMIQMMKMMEQHKQAGLRMSTAQ